ncbi:MAG: hypothetical protein AAF629_05990 [Chloroflexota bacterium]
MICIKTLDMFVVMTRSDTKSQELGGLFYCAPSLANAIAPGNMGNLTTQTGATHHG